MGRAVILDGGHGWRASDPGGCCFDEVELQDVRILHLDLSSQCDSLVIGHGGEFLWSLAMAVATYSL
jgi:hypothetical protein